MPAKQNIFPFEIVNNSVEKHLQAYEPRSRVLYLLLLTLFLIAIVLLFIIKVDVTVRSTGLLRSEQERTEIRSLVSGLVDSVLIKENEHVKAGQPLIKLAAASVADKNLSLGTQVSELQLQQQDLQQLVAGRNTRLKSSMYQQQIALYNRQLTDADIRLNTAQKKYERFRSLHKDKVISNAEFERYDYEYKALMNEKALLKAQQSARWQSELTALNLQLQELGARQTLYEEEQDQYTIRAAADGYVQQLKGLQRGSTLGAGEVLGEVSPDAALLAEVFVLPKDIGYIHEGTPVRMQVDAYDYNQWGMITGKVVTISKDVVIDKGQPLFKIRCAVDQQALQLKNGYKGYIKKGMTVQARFLVTRRTLFQLLYDQADDWLNPNLVKNEA
ncbi:HlyD family secretion protein [Chitinophaga horti]|uniref:HlyD family secretion protein n=1 Tax=Chitinophaga horti TaxID=2920382 RepID=A0ABY6J602_9BACT|nr:HlyD family secretion protein [Chitinophaga horti]UYQ94930.1 HlyD family secretion protein [Chitinophaga horti]